MRFTSHSLFVTTLFLRSIGLRAEDDSKNDHNVADIPSYDQKLLHVVNDQRPLQPTDSETEASFATPFWLDQQDHTGSARGFAPFIESSHGYPVYRNVKSYKASGDGKHDDTDALQQAINDDGNKGNRYRNEVTTRPALVYVPSGTYILTKKLDMRLNTILVGDPKNRPVFKASANFQGSIMIDGVDFATDGTGGTTNFLVALKSIVIDTTNVKKDKDLTALNWGVAQGCHLTNVDIHMPTGSKGHIGITMTQGSTIAVTDVSIFGGAVGIRNGNQQVLFKNISFKYCTTALQQVGGFVVVLQGAKVDTCAIGVDTTSAGQLGTVIVFDSSSVNSGPMVKSHDSSNDNGPRNQQIVIENLDFSGKGPVVISEDWKTMLESTKNVDTWIWGNVSPGTYQTGKTLKTKRSPELLKSGKFFTLAQPTYADFPADKVLNVKDVKDFPVKGDGKTDDSSCLNAILAQNAANGKLTYFPYGVYILKSTLYVPPNTRIVGEAWPVLSGTGPHFSDPSNPKPVIQIGKPNERGTVHISDMRFTVASPSPGAIILQINLAGHAPGDVALHNTHVTIGGTADSTVNTACHNPDTANCKAAFLLVHLTASSSAYLENMWAWTADHSLERGGPQNIATGRGILVESRKGTWLTGTGSEHHTLYNYNINHARNVFAALQQSETAYWQGEGSRQDAPAPWTPDPRFGDPDWLWCTTGAGQGKDKKAEQRCRMGLAQNIQGSEGIWLHGAAFWTFFHGEVSGCYDCKETICGEGCIMNAARVGGGVKGLWWFGVNTRCADVMVLDGKDNPKQYHHPGGWPPGGTIAGYLGFSGS